MLRCLLFPLYPMLARRDVETVAKVLAALPLTPPGATLDFKPAGGGGTVQEIAPGKQIRRALVFVNLIKEDTEAAREVRADVEARGIPVDVVPVRRGSRR